MIFTHMYYRSNVGNVPETAVQVEDEMEGKECSGVSEQYNILGHSTPGPSACAWPDVTLLQGISFPCKFC
jgi:hypothetical protein